MNGRGLAAALVGSVLAAVSAPVPAAAAPALAAPVVPCPTEKLSPPPQRPPKPKAPALDPAHARVGGEALATTGLAIPGGAPAPPKLTASTWLVADLDTGQVLGGCNPHGYETPASVQKVLLAATMIPRLDPKQVVQVTRDDLKIERGSSAVGLLEGGRYSVETLWYGLLFDSGNDAANVLARVGGGDKGQAGGVAMMNAEARRLGALQTHAVTPSGLDGPGQFTSAYDLVLIARAAFALPDFRKYVAAKTAKIPPQPPKDPRGFQIQNDNGLLQKYPGALGGKSGFTTLARHSFVGAAKRGNRTLVAAVLGAEARPIRASEQTAKLLDWGFALPADASVGRLVEPGEVDVAPTPPGARQPGAAEGAARPSDGAAGSSSAAVIGLAVAVAAVLLVMLFAATRRRAAVRARRAAQRRVPAPGAPDRAGGARPRRVPAPRVPDEVGGRAASGARPRRAPAPGAPDQVDGRAASGARPRRAPAPRAPDQGLWAPDDDRGPRPGGAAPQPRRPPRPRSDPRAAGHYDAPDAYNPPPSATDRPTRPDARAWDDRPPLPGQRAGGTGRRPPTAGYPQPERRPPNQRRPSHDLPTADGFPAPGDRRPRQGPAGPDAYRHRDDDGWR